MNFSRNLACVAIAMLGLTLIASDAAAAMIAYDNAGDSAYNSGTVIGVNGGYGWGGPWSANPIVKGPTLHVGSSSWIGGTALDTSDINSPQSPNGRAWEVGAIWDQGPSITTTVSRAFSGPLIPEQTFSIDIDVYPDVQALITLGDVTVATGDSYNGAIRYEVQSLAGPNGSLVTDFGAPATEFGAHISFMPLTDSTAQVTITSLAPGGESDSFILPYSTLMSGMVAQHYGPVLTNSGLLYMNNMSITPEPDGIALAIAAFAMILLGHPRMSRRVHW